MAISVRGGQSFEQCLEVKWDTGGAKFREFFVEMVLDRAPGPDDGALQPAPDAMVKSVAARGPERSATIKNMPGGRYFLIAVKGRDRTGWETRSPWIRMNTLSPLGPKEQSNEDPLRKPRLHCRDCNCKRYVANTWTQTEASLSRCRCCGCSYSEHEILNVSQALRERERQACKRLQRESVVPLLEEALEWSDRECALWFCTDGAFHPLKADTRATERKPDGTMGKKGRVSVITPTTESRQNFHKMLWACFEAQVWPDKELIVVETHNGHASKFLKSMEKKDKRLHYVSFFCQPGTDWSIGVKRNLGVHLATGEILVSFDDDDLYAPMYLRTMVDGLEAHPEADLVKLSSWYIWNAEKDKWGFCDPITWGLTKGLNEWDRTVRQWAYGYGFSYVFRRQAALDVCFEDKNFGEDFDFIMKLQLRKGEQSIALIRDDSGICLHVQHGANSSDSIPLRTVTHEEAIRLDIMDLSRQLSAPPRRLLNRHVGLGFTAGPGEGEAGETPISALLLRVPLEQRIWSLEIHAKELDFTLPCKCGLLVMDILKNVKAHIFRKRPDLASTAPWTRLGSWRTFCVPPPGSAPEGYRDKVAGGVLGIAYLEDEAKSAQLWRTLLDKAKGPMQREDRISLHTAELWLVPPPKSKQANAVPKSVSGDFVLEDFVSAHGVVKRPDGKKALPGVSTAFEVRLFESWGATVDKLRLACDPHLPSSAEVLEQLPDDNWVKLADSDATPQRFAVSDFRGHRSFYMKFTKNQAHFFLTSMQEVIARPGMQKRLDKLQKEADGNDRAYNGLLGKLLRQEAYPPLVLKMGLPEQAIDVEFIAEALQPASRMDRELAELELSVSWGLRASVAVASAVISVNWFRMLEGLPPVVVPFTWEDT